MGGVVLSPLLPYIFISSVEKFQSWLISTFHQYLPTVDFYIVLFKVRYVLSGFVKNKGHKLTHTCVRTVSKPK